MKADLDLVRSVLERQELDIRVLNRTMQELEVEVKNEAELAAAEKEAPVPKQYVILLADPEGKLAGMDLAGWIVQIPEEESPATAFERLAKSADQHNHSQKGMRKLATTVASACERIPNRIAREHGLWIRTKDPVFAFAKPQFLEDGL
jgi:hypothetical protein